jgi:hypothetical protein
MKIELQICCISINLRTEDARGVQQKGKKRSFNLDNKCAKSIICNDDGNDVIDKNDGWKFHTLRICLCAEVQYPALNSSRIAPTL